MRHALLVCAAASLLTAGVPLLAHSSDDGWSKVSYDQAAQVWDADAAGVDKGDSAYGDGPNPSGDGMTYGGLLRPTPELGTWALLLCTGGVAGWLRRRLKAS